MREFYARARRLASALAQRGIGPATPSPCMLANTPPMLEAPLRRADDAARCCTRINTRLDAPIIAFQLDHGEAKVLITDREFARRDEGGAGARQVTPLVIDYDDPEFPQTRRARWAASTTRRSLAEGDPDFAWRMPADEWDAIALNYTSGTTGNPKGVVYHHRGAALMGYANVRRAGMGRTPSICGRCRCSTATAGAFPGRSRPSRARMCASVGARQGDVRRRSQTTGVTHLCGAPIVMSTLLNADAGGEARRRHRVEFVTAAAPPPEAVLAAMAEAGFNVTHVYGLTETYGPAVVNEWHEEWNASRRRPSRRACKARQGVRYPALEELTVMDPETMQRVPADGETLGEVMFRGNIVMKGYLKNPKATEEAFAGGWFHSGDLGVLHPDGYIQLKDRSKDIIISGGENISSIEVEDALYKHPAVSAAAVVAKPDEKWGETPCAFVELQARRAADGRGDHRVHCRGHLARYKVPRPRRLRRDPQDLDRQDPEIPLREMARDAKSGPPMAGRSSHAMAVSAVIRRCPAAAGLKNAKQSRVRGRPRSP